jgi:hypothetical protein
MLRLMKDIKFPLIYKFINLHAFLSFYIHSYIFFLEFLSKLIINIQLCYLNVFLLKSNS